MADRPGQGVGRLTVAGDTLLFLDGGDSSLYALSTVDGSLRWKVSGVQGPPSGYLLVVDGVVIATSSAVQVVNTTTAVDLLSGKALWKQPMGASSLLAGNGIVYKTRVLPSGDAQPVTNGYIQALNPATGAVLWQADGHAYFGASLIGNDVYTADATTGLYAFNAQTGAKEWSQPRTGISWLIQKETTVYFGDGKQMYALNTTTRAIQWQTPFSSYGGVLYESGVLCASDAHFDLYGFDAQTGARLWHVSEASSIPLRLADAGLYVTASIASQGDGALVTAIDAKSGATRWTAHVPDFADEGIAAGGVIYVDSAVRAVGNGQHGIVSALSEAGGTTLWHFDTGTDRQGSIAVG